MMVKFSETFNHIKIKIASPTAILKWAKKTLPSGESVGEVKTYDTLNYRTQKPENDGLFCERIFGPTQNFSCSCQKYQTEQFTGLVCEKCGVEVNHSRVRRYRMGYIKLVHPTAHVWYINSIPNYMALLLETGGFEKKLGKETLYSTSKNDYLASLSPRIISIKDKRVKRIKLTSLIYFIAKDFNLLYWLNWDLRQYRRSRELGYSNYPTRPRPNTTPDEYKNFDPLKSSSLTSNILMGTQLIKHELEKLNLKSEIIRSRCFLLVCTKILSTRKYLSQKYNWALNWEKQRFLKIRKQTVQRIRILENLKGTGVNPAWMILTLLPVIPPDLRPIIKLENGKMATSDLNELYKNIIERNTRLFGLLESGAPQITVINERRLIQESVDSLIENGKNGNISCDSNNRPLKSLSQIIKGKYGRFRQNLLGKRVDYSGRSVIVVGPSLKINQCGLPYKMAIELFKPFISGQLIKDGRAKNIIHAKKLIKENVPNIEPILKKILAQYPIFLNRAPTLHRLGIQAFEPVLLKGKAIKLHPLVCSAFNADFDGDQMAIHVPLSAEAQVECYTLMLAPYNFLSPANGQPVILPSQDMVLGCYYLTLPSIENLLGSNHYFANLNDAVLAYTQKKLELHSIIWIRVEEKQFKKTVLLKSTRLSDGTTIEHYKNKQIRKTNSGKIISSYIKTTVGRSILNLIIQKTLNII